MTTTSITAPVTEPPAPRAHRPSSGSLSRRSGRRPATTYRRRRLVALTGVVAAVVALVQVGGEVLSGPGGVPASATGAATAPPVAHVRAEPGDSLWSIALRHRGDVAVSRYVERLIRLNGGTAIEAGQLVRLP